MGAGGTTREGLEDKNIPGHFTTAVPLEQQQVVIRQPLEVQAG